MGAARPSGKEAPGQVLSMHWALAGCGHTRRGHRPCRLALDPSPGSGSLSALPQALVLPLLCPVSCEHWRDCGVCHHAPNDSKPSVYKFRSSNILIINSNATSPPHSFLLQASNDFKTFILFGVSRMGLTESVPFWLLANSVQLGHVPLSHGDPIHPPGRIHQSSDAPGPGTVAMDAPGLLRLNLSQEPPDPGTIPGFKLTRASPKSFPATAVYAFATQPFHGGTSITPASCFVFIYKAVRVESERRLSSNSLVKSGVQIKLGVG